jgi:hypothetical protein
MSAVEYNPLLMNTNGSTYYQQAPYKPRTGRPGRDPAEERRIVRQSSVKAAIEWLSVVYAAAETKPTSADVLKLAERFEQWVYR